MGFFKNIFNDVKESTIKQHQVDKANLQAAKSQAKVTWEEAKLSPKQRQKLMQIKREEKINEANKKTSLAEQQLENIKKIKGE